MTTTSAMEQARERFFEGVGHFEAQRYEAAHASFEAALALAPGRPSVLANLGITRFHLRHWEDSVATLLQVAQLDPGSLDAWSYLGLAYQALGRWQPAVEALERALALDPDRAGWWLTCGQCRVQAGQAQKALRDIDRALELDPRLGRAWSERGGILREMYRLEEAAECFERAIALGDDADLNGYYLASVRGTGEPVAPPRRYVESLFDGYAAEFQTHLVERLGYRGPEVLIGRLGGMGRHFRSALDLGCGTGLCGPLLQPLADTVDGIDVSAAMLDQARALGVYRELVHADLVSFLQSTDRRDDLVLAADVFVYVGDLSAVFQSVRRILEPGGCFAFTVEASADGQDLHLLTSLRYAHSEAYIRRLAQAHGFVVCELFQAPLRHDQQRPVEAIYVYLE